MSTATAAKLGASVGAEVTGADCTERRRGHPV